MAISLIEGPNDSSFQAIFLLQLRILVGMSFQIKSYVNFPLSTLHK